MLFAVATAVGSSHVRSINPLELGRKTWDQSQFGAAVALACGRGYGEMGADVPPTVSSFLAGRSDRVSCSELPRDLPSRPLLPAQRLYRYLLWMVAGTWWLRGVSWSGLWPLFGILYGATVAAGYGIFRLGMGRALATLASLAVTTSALNLTSLLTLRDYAKAPFLLVLIVIVAHIVKRLDRPRSLLTLATLFGLTAGIGFGFRNDVLVLAPVLVFTVLLWHPPRDWRTWQVRLAAIGVAALTFTASSAPILSAYARGSNSGHVALVGLMSPLNDRFGISASIYDWGYVFRDEFATTLINSYTDRVHGHPVAYFTPEYDRAITGYVLQIVRHWPADMLARADASVFRIANLPFAVGSYTSPVPEGVSSPVLVQLFSLENRLRSVLAGTGVAVVGVALCLVSATSPS
ncbi:MAG TPA: hypothetical protein VNZ26_25425, partial [Vicinamibacterales bacterium]|nr:hypothetical protein [Vicinamibacterales bacterium]